RGEDTDLRGDLEVVDVRRADERHHHEERDREQSPPEPPRHGREIDEEHGALEEQEREDGARERRHGPSRNEQERQRDGGRHARVATHARSLTTSPTKPLGGKIRMRIRIENAKMSLYSAPKAPPVSSER